ncbi:MAG: hypothetical protein WCI55_00490 [Armatimonadota bacterium]
MAYRSLLEDAKRIEDLGEFCHNIEWTEENESKINEYDQKWLDRLKADKLPVDDCSRNFFGSRLHDSYVQSIDRAGDNLEITIHNDYAEEFVKAYFRVQGKEFVMPLLPICMSFEGVCYSTTCIQDLDGYLQTCDIPNVPRQEMPSYTSRFVVDWFHEVDGRIQWIAEIDAVGVTARSKNRAYYSHLLVDCSKVSAVDGRGKAIEKAFGRDCYEVWVACKEHFSTRSWGCYLIEDFIRERQLGLPKP